MLAQYCRQYGPNYYNCLLVRVCYILELEGSTSANPLRISMSLSLLNVIADFIPIEIQSLSWLKQSGKSLSYLAEGYSSCPLGTSSTQSSLTDKIATLRKALVHIESCASLKTITYDSLTTIEDHFVEFNEICRSLSVEKLIDVNYVRSSISSYDLCVKEINTLLIHGLTVGTSILQ